MKNKISIYSFFWVFLTMVTVTAVNGQEKKLIQANQDYEKLNFINAQKIYLSVAENGYKSEELCAKLANSYYFNAQYDQAVKWYDDLFSMVEKPKESIIYLRYSQALKAIGKSKQAMKYYNIFVGENDLEESPLLAEDYLRLIKENSGRYDLDPIRKIYNKNKISFGNTMVKDTLYYTSTKDSDEILNKKSGWDGLSFLSLYEVQLDSLNQAVSDPKMLKGNLKGKFHESSPVFTADNNTMYFTRSNITFDDKIDDYKLKIYKSKKINNKWQEAVELSINSDNFSTAHPTLNSDGTKLYFSSDRPGGYGESDIYVSTISPEGHLGEPVNLGPEVNTEGKETFPFITTLNELYFSSDGHFGLGGLDIFYIKILDNHYGNLLNVGEPLNSNADDFAFGINMKTNRGFISSNRSTREGEFVYDNIYVFKEKTRIVDVYLSNIDGYVIDKQSKQPIRDARVSLRDSHGDVFHEVVTDENGFYSIETNKYKSYFIKSEKERYDTDENISKINIGHQEINFELQQNIVDLVPGMNLAEVLNIPIIYFDYDKSNIRDDAEVELQKILVALNTYPDLKLEIRSHTDSRGSDDYNMKLSSRRAQSTLDYLVSKNINSDRLVAKGFGETLLINTCSNGVECSEAEHQKNRRSEFIVVK
ncbi:OmpA family protein [uncultured Formosa sp.]|uniref:OmpA family protein n=1 Tax=uncultured Formosa sp. TaxID=255435 RepID=UPI00261F4675|nr:OmpA family protein [uncultured Formosa sp.]